MSGVTMFQSGKFFTRLFENGEFVLKYMMSIENLSLVVFGLWLLILSGAFIWFFIRLNKMLAKSKGQNMMKTIEKVLKQEEKNSDLIKSISKDLKQIEDAHKLHVQKIGIVRFNPFNETGGDHSFTIALLNGKDTGIVLTGLHTRERTRMYLKPIESGKSEYELSSEETKAIAKAKKG
ncbi:DUF4446 family protein [Patescibacteria group bacterium]